MTCGTRSTAAAAAPYTAIRTSMPQPFRTVRRSIRLAFSRHNRVVADVGEFLAAEVPHGLDELLRDAAQPEATH